MKAHLGDLSQISAHQTFSTYEKQHLSKLHIHFILRDSMTDDSLSQFPVGQTLINIPSSQFIKWLHSSCLCWLSTDMLASTTLRSHYSIEIRESSANAASPTIIYSLQKTATT